jgi:predicted heme/steroid binding protein
MIELSRRELRRYNGKSGAPAYIAFNGKVYDVSRSFLWCEGNHQVFHDAGLDLTAELKQAPHGEDLIEKFSIVGVLRED